MYEIKEVNLLSNKPGIIVERFHDHGDAMKWINNQRDERKPGDAIVHGIVNEVRKK